MNAIDRLQADYAGTGLTIGPHPMSLHRTTLALRGVLRAIDLTQARDGRRVRIAGMVITRQRPGTAKGFVFLTLEDETGISNVIIRPDLFDRQRTEAVRMPFLLVDGIMQQQDGVRSVKAERLEALDKLTASPDSHDFYDPPDRAVAQVLHGRSSGCSPTRLSVRRHLASRPARVCGASPR
jgi:error-prone DNA polymerase